MTSYYEGLPIYRAAADLVVLLDKVVREFSRFHKYSLGTRLRDGATDVVLSVAKCNRRDERLRNVVSPSLLAAAESVPRRNHPDKSNKEKTP